GDQTRRGGSGLSDIRHKSGRHRDTNRKTPALSRPSHRTELRSSGRRVRSALGADGRRPRLRMRRRFIGALRAGAWGGGGGGGRAFFLGGGPPKGGGGPIGWAWPRS